MDFDEIYLTLQQATISTIPNNLIVMKMMDIDIKQHEISKTINEYMTLFSDKHRYDPFSGPPIPQFRDFTFFYATIFKFFVGLNNS